MNRATSRSSSQMARGPSFGNGPRECTSGTRDGKKYLDLTAAFGVAATGHANPRVVRAGQKQMARLLHAMGDVHPHALKAQLARELSRITFERWQARAKVQSLKSKVIGGRARVAAGKTIFCNSGFEAVEAALKTAMLATGKPGVIAFEGAYHGLGYGALNATHRATFPVAFPPPASRVRPLCAVSRSRPGVWPGLKLESRMRRLVPSRERLARFWSSRFRCAAASTFRRRDSCRCCAGFATSTKPC